jgi:hypothetical protein
MNLEYLAEQEQSQESAIINRDRKTEGEKILCAHCQRTATNGLKCKGICVSDNDY